MSRGKRSRRPAGAAPGDAAGEHREAPDGAASGGAADAGATPDDGREASPASAPARSWAVDLAIMLGAFAGATLIAELAGAANLGTALTFGQIAFALAAVYVILRR